MIRSMTGYGEGSTETEAGTVRVEIRTVNHRYLNVNARLPSALNAMEATLREALKAFFSRGHVNITVRLDTGAADTSGRTYRLDDDKVRNYMALFERLGDEFGVQGKPDLPLLARFNDIIVRADEDDPLAGLEFDQLSEALSEAGRQAVGMREEEGRRLEIDLRGRIDAMEAALAAVEQRAPSRLEEERSRLRSAVAELLDGKAPDPDRLAQEIAFLAEKWDINEELVRFRSHNDLFIQLLDAAADEPVGKRLSFLVQEMHREANTIGSKANDSAIAHQVVAIKDELERLREQVENVE